MVALIYQCPVCGGVLFQRQRQYLCSKKHAFDLAKEGYVNLHLAKGQREHGDNQAMSLARHHFLKAGHYQPLAQQLKDIVNGLCQGQEATVIDSGCGEGYYLKYLAENTTFFFYGFDLSKSAIKLACKPPMAIHFAVANVFKLPVLESTVDMVMSIFSPFNETEVQRVLKPNGHWVVVRPGGYHLLELKQCLYDEVKLNENTFKPTLFEMLDTQMLTYDILLTQKEDMANLLKMTPYYWKTPQEKIEQLLNQTHQLQTRVEFEIYLYHKLPRFNPPHTSKLTPVI